MSEEKADYDCTEQVLAHRRRVAFWIQWMTTDVLLDRALNHDESKLHPPEKEIFDHYSPLLKQLTFGSDEYKAALEKMGEGLRHHYQANPHHPEFHPRGIDGMTIWDLIEMVADWMAAASEKEASLDLDYLEQRFNLSPQLKNIISNTIWQADMENVNFRIPSEFSPKENFTKPMREGDSMAKKRPQQVSNPEETPQPIERLFKGLDTWVSLVEKMKKNGVNTLIIRDDDAVEIKGKKVYAPPHFENIIKNLLQEANQ